MTLIIIIYRQHYLNMAMNSVEVVTSEELNEAPGTPGVVREVAFETDNNMVVQARVAGGTATEWHHHCDRHVYAYLLKGKAIIEAGPGGRDRHEFEAGDFVHIPPRTIHRDINPTDEEQIVIINFVGSGPLVENVDGPASE